MTYGNGYRLHATYDPDEYITRRFEGGPATGYHIPVPTDLPGDKYRYVCPDITDSYRMADLVLVAEYRLASDGVLYYMSKRPMRRPSGMRSEGV